MTITSYLLVLSLLWLLALFFIFEIWSFAYSLDDDAMASFPPHCNSAYYAASTDHVCILYVLWLYRWSFLFQTTDVVYDLGITNIFHCGM